MARTPGSRSSTSDPKASEVPEADSVVVGRIAGARGIQGELRFVYFSEDPETLRGVTELRLVPAAGAGVARRFRVKFLQPGRKGELRLALEGVDSRDAAEALGGCEAHASAAELPPLPEGEHYGHEIIGCEVFDSEGARLGVVQDIWVTGAPDVLVVRADDGAEHLVPAALMLEVDTAARRLSVELPPGLLDGNPA